MTKTILRYKYTHFDEGSLRIIKDGTIKFTRPSELNDPFDSDPEIDANKYLSSNKVSRKILRKVGDDLGLSPAQRLQQKPKMLKNVENAIKNGEFGQPLGNWVGICSLTRNPLNLLMWAHYAKDHTGFVTEFCIPSTQEKFNEAEALEWLVPLEVEYSKEKPIIDPNDDNRKICEKSFLVKGYDWKYEQEVRVLDSYRGYGIHPFDRKRILKSVIAGMKMCDEHFNQLKNAVETMNNELNINVKVYKATPLRGKFALFVPGRDDLSQWNVF
jgi:Protein of unknown function (DUF2971)